MIRTEERYVQRRILNFLKSCFALFDREYPTVMSEIANSIITRCSTAKYLKIEFPISACPLAKVLANLAGFMNQRIKPKTNCRCERINVHSANFLSVDSNTLFLLHPVKNRYSAITITTSKIYRIPP